MKSQGVPTARTSGRPAGRQEGIYGPPGKCEATYIASSSGLFKDVSASNVQGAALRGRAIARARWQR